MTDKLSYVKAVIATARKRGESQRAGITALMVVGAESGFQMYANSNVPESLTYPHDAVGHDHLSVGLYQQQTPMWGTCAELMNVETSTNKFFEAYHTHKGIEALPLERAAQLVQGSAFASGSNYLAHKPEAVSYAALYWGKTTPADIGDAIKDAPGKAIDGLTQSIIPKVLLDRGTWIRFGVGAIGATLIMLAVWKLLSDNPEVQAVLGTAVKTAKKTRRTPKPKVEANA